MIFGALVGFERAPTTALGAAAGERRHEAEIALGRGDRLDDARGAHMRHERHT